MTLDEAIKHSEEVAENNEANFRLCPYPSEMCDGKSNCRALKHGKGKGCLKCAQEHRQLARWLKELKVFRDEIEGMSNESEIFVGYLRKQISEIQ